MNISAFNNGKLYFPNQVGLNDPQNGNKGGMQKEGLNFSQIINQKIEEVNALQKEADQLTESFMVGEPVEIHQMLIAMEKADLALRETVEIRNKLVEAYKGLERIQI